MKCRRLFQYLMAILLIIALIPLFQAPPAASAQENNTEITRDTPFVPGELVVSFAAGSNAEQNAAVMDLMSKNFGVQSVRGEAQTVLLRGEAQLDVEAAAKAMEQLPGVEYAEPNYIYWIPEPAATPEGAQRDTQFVTRKSVEKNSETGVNENRYNKMPVSGLQSMKTKRSGKIQAVYPNDDYLWSNWGWSWVGADIVSSNTTSSANVCVIDTGVDYLHKDLAGKVIKGYDFVSDDADPMDNNGHGTHVAGIIAAVKGNSEGIAGVSTGKVVAVKAMTAQGWGTNYAIGQAILYCASRSDVRVINLSLGSPYPSEYIKGKIGDAVTAGNKLVVAAAGNDSYFYPLFYPAAYTLDFPDKVLAVAAAGLHPDGNPTDLIEDCWASQYSNYGSWISMVAPGTDILSTLPWDKPFYLNNHDGFQTRYDTMSGTSMAAPFVAAAAARAWGYMLPAYPTVTNAEVGQWVYSAGWKVVGDGSCWPTDMDGASYVNVASILERGAALASAYDASSGTPLNGATVSVYRGTTSLGSGIITADTFKATPTATDPSRVYTNYNDWTEIINLPVNWDNSQGYTGKLSKSGYTASPQKAFMDKFFDGVDGNLWVCGGCWSDMGQAYVPPKSANFDIVMDAEALSHSDENYLDLDVELPHISAGYDTSQLYDYMVGPQGEAYSNDPADASVPFGSLTYRPYAHYRYGFAPDIGVGDDPFPPMENIVIKKRSAHGASGTPSYVPANVNLPYWAGAYTVWVSSSGNPLQQLQEDVITDTERRSYPLSISVWKDGVIKKFARYNFSCGWDDRWWKALEILSLANAATAPIYTEGNACFVSKPAPTTADPFIAPIKIAR